MLGGKWQDEKIIYRENSEMYPERDGYYQYHNKEVLDFVIIDNQIWKERDTVSGKNIHYSYSFAKDHPSHVTVKEDPNGVYDTYKECLTVGYDARMDYWAAYEAPLSPTENDIALLIATDLIRLTPEEEEAELTKMEEQDMAELEKWQNMDLEEDYSF